MIFYISLLALAVAPAFLAQNVAICTDRNFTWAFNSLGQSPCYVAMALTRSCPPGVYPGPISPGSLYVGPSSGDANDCTCNSVSYSLFCACGYCQDGGCTPWLVYTQYCNQTFLMRYPETIPNDINIPSWAYLDIPDNGFNVTAAASASGPDSTAPPSLSPSATSTSTSTSSASAPTSTSTSSSASTSTSNSSYLPKTSIRAVAGGIAGGVICAGLSVALVFWIYIRQKSQRVAQASTRSSGQEILPSPLSDVNPASM